MRETLAVKYRPKTLQDVTEQEEVVVILKNQLTNKDFKNSYLFTGASGVGKTTIGRILAREINGGAGGLTEIDAASNSGVDNIREILELANYQALDAEYTIFIIDECHSLSSASYQALLKTLEEPPAKTIFIFCTTDPQKIPATILNRVQRFDLTRISQEGIINRLNYIIQKEQEEDKSINISEDVVDYIAKIANGGMRDAITYLDKCLSYKTNLELEDVVRILGSVNYDILFDLFFSIYNYQEKEVIEIIEEIHNQGKDLKLFIKHFMSFLLDVCKFKLFKNYKYVQIPNIFDEQMQRAINADSNFLKSLLDKINEISSKIRYESMILPIVETELLLLSRDVGV